MNQQMKAELKFPIFSFFPRNNMVYVCWKANDYNTTDIKWFKRNKRKKDLVVDATGMMYRVKSAHFVRWKGIHGFIGLQCGIIEIENEYEENPVRISLRELQEIVMERYPKSRWFKEECWDNVEDFRQTVLGCKSFEELAEMFRRRPSKNIFLRIWKGY